MATRKPRFVFWRLVLLAVLFVSGVITGTIEAPPIVEHAPAGLLFGFFAVAIALSPLMALFVVAIQLFNPFSDDTWELPTHDSNPFHLGNPLLLVHFAGFLSIANGLGYLVAALWSGTAALTLGITAILFGLGLLLGLRLSIRMSARKLFPEQAVRDEPSR